MPQDLRLPQNPHCLATDVESKLTVVLVSEQHTKPTLGFSGKFGETMFVPHKSKLRAGTLKVGTGKHKLNNAQWRELGGKIAQAVTKLEAQTCNVNLPKMNFKAQVSCGNGLLCGSYDQRNKAKPIKFGVAGFSANAIKQATIIAHSSKIVRDLGNMPANIFNPQTAEDMAGEIVAGQANVSIEVLHPEDLAAKGLNLLNAVGGASNVAPRMIVVKVRRNPNSKKVTASFVGKGVTFDTGGVQIKPGDAMDGMHMDMCGAATFLGLLHYILQNNVQINADFIFGMAENATGANAYRPGDVVTSGGISTRVSHTDAEGRLVLADCLLVAAESNPKHVVDAATLTGSTMVGLEYQYSAVFGNDEKLIAQVVAAGKTSGDKVWHMPLDEYHVNQLKKCDSADTNSNHTRWGSASFAAGYLSQFVPAKSKWVHLDIAGSAMAGETLFGNTVKDAATGRPLLMLVELLKNLK